MHVLVVVTVLFVRALSSLVPDTSPLTITMVEPGLCKTDLGREFEQSISGRIAKFMIGPIARKPEEGGRAIACGALVTDPRKIMHNKDAKQYKGSFDGRALHGKYIANTRLTEESDFVISEDGKRMAQRIWVSMIGPILSLQMLI